MEVLRHVRNVRREGLAVLLGIGTLAAALIGLQLWFFPFLWRDHPWLTTALYASLAINVLAAAVYVTLNVCSNREFICQLDDEYLECISPVRACGESFKVSLRDVTKVAKSDFGDSHSWYIYDRDGNRHWLTDCYENPAGEFVASLKARNPAVVEVDS